jgi:hypothetical protein
MATFRRDLGPAKRALPTGIGARPAAESISEGMELNPPVAG